MMDLIAFAAIVAAAVFGYRWMSQVLQDSGRGRASQIIMGVLAGNVAWLFAFALLVMIGLIDVDDAPEPVADAEEPATAQPRPDSDPPPANTGRELAAPDAPGQLDTPTGEVEMPPSPPDQLAADGENASFESAYEAIEAGGSYPPEYQQLERMEGGVRISPLVYENDRPEVVRSETARAAVVAVYTTFIDTDADQVRVVAFPMRTDIKQTFHQPLDVPTHDLTVTRRQAADAADDLVGMTAFEQLTKPFGNLWGWSDKGNALQYSDQGPGAFVTLERLRGSN
ncbi:MAG: hypothetical protein RLO11_00170 [Salinisphaeraceae bacterium]